MSAEDEVQAGYRFLAAVLFLLISLPLTAYVLFPNSYTLLLAYPAILLTVPIHEFGHLFTFWALSPFASYESVIIPTAFAGSFFQIGVPFLLIMLFIFGNKQYAIACLLMVVMGESAFHVGSYIKSSNNPSGTGINVMGEVGEVTRESHDWYIILNHYNLLDKADILGDFVTQFGIAILLIGFFSSVFEVNRLMNYSKSSDFMLLMLYGSAVALLFTIAYFNLLRLILLVILSILPLLHFRSTILPKLENDMEKADKQLDEPETKEEQPAKSWFEEGDDEKKKG